MEAGHICLLRSTRLRALSLTSCLVLKLLQRRDELACLHSRNFAKPLVSLLLWEETHILHWHLQKARHAGSLHKCTCHSAWPSCGPGASVSSHQRNSRPSCLQKNIACCLPGRVLLLDLKNVYSLILCNIYCEYGEGKNMSGS